MQVFSIYKATNKVNNKVYIGFDSEWPYRRQTHEWSSFNKNTKDYNCIFHRAIRKYGIKNFKWEIICQHHNGKFLLKIMEPYFIDAYNSFYLTGHGYNMTKGGEGCLGYKHQKETIDKMCQYQKNIIKTTKHQENLAKSHIGNSNRAKNYLLIDPKGNKHKIKNLAKFCRDNPQYNLSYSSLSMLIAVAKGKRKHHKGWKCNYV